MLLIYRFQSGYTSQQLKNRIAETSLEYSIPPNAKENRIFYKLYGPFLTFFCFPEASQAWYGIQFQGIIIPSKKGCIILGGFGPRLSILIALMVFVAVMMRDLYQLPVVLLSLSATYLIIYSIFSLIGKNAQQNLLKYIKDSLLAC